MPVHINAQDTDLYQMGKAEGKAEGISLGKAEGISLGKAEGISLGKAEGISLGKAEGLSLGKAEGELKGMLKGKAEGKRLALEETVKRLYHTKKLPIDQIADLLDIDETLIQSIINAQNK